MRGRALKTETTSTSASAARAQWSRLLNDVFRRRSRVIVEKSGIPVAAIVSIADLARLEQLDAKRERDFAILDEIRGAFADVPQDELEREVNRAVAEVRAEMRAEREARSESVAVAE